MNPELALLAILLAAPSHEAVPGPRRGSVAPQAVEGAHPSKEKLIRTWEGRLAERVEELVRDGHEDAVLGPLARHPVAARFMLGYFRRSDRLLQRKLAPGLARLLLKDAPPETLDDLFDGEAARRAEVLRGASAPGGDPRTNAVNRVIERMSGRPGIASLLDAQSVVEDVVIAARSWCGEPSRARAGAAVLRKIVEGTIGGERWNSSGPAMKGLVCDCREGAGDLQSRFAAHAFAVGPYGAPLPDVLEARRVVEELRAGKCDEPRNPGARESADPLAGWNGADRAELRAFLGLAESMR